MTSHSDWPPRWEGDPLPRADARTGAQLTFWSLHTTASLLLNFHNLLAEVRHQRGIIAQGDRSQFDLDRRARVVQAAVDDITAIVAELRARGHSVDWEE